MPKCEACYTAAHQPIPEPVKKLKAGETQTAIDLLWHGLKAEKKDDYSREWAQEPDAQKRSCQKVIRDPSPSGCQTSRAESPQHQSAIIGERGRSHEEQAGVQGLRYRGTIIRTTGWGFSAEVSIQEHDADGVMETEFYLPDTFPTQESAIEAGIQAGRQKINVRFERGSAVVNG